MTHIGATPTGLFQQTLKAPVQCIGIGLHSGAKVALRISPADIDTGIVFIRTDKRGSAARIAARWDQVVDTRLCTVIGNADGTTIGTVEHLMAALAGAGIDNALISIDGAEVPIMDGSAAPFLALIDRVGVREQSAPRRVIRVLNRVSVGSAGASATLSPDSGSVFSFEIDFDSKVIAQQSARVELSDDVFRDEISEARTFGFLHEVEAMRRAGLARGGSLDNAVVVDKERDRVLNEGGLRYSDEFVRHKILDAVGDLALAGAPIIGHFQGLRCGHALNNQLLRALFADRSNWCHDTQAGLTPSGWSAFEPHIAA